MDPLSISASVVALVGAAAAVKKTLQKVLSLRNAPLELLCIINDVCL
jgi:hypothetical protein